MTDGGSEHAIRAQDLHKSFGDVEAVRGLSLELKQGECLALLGPNGAGKTTTVEMLEGLLAPDRGEISILGLSYRHQRRQILERMSVLLQETRLYRKFTVMETISLFASFYSKSLDPEPILARLQLTDKRNARLEHLSGGMMQRVYIGCCLINDPELIFLDEPTTGLDPQARRMLWELLAQVKAEGRSILLTTHYMEEAEQLADRVAVIDHGQVIAEGSPHGLIRKICGEQVLRFAMEASSGPSVEAMSQALPWWEDAKPVDEGFELVTTDAPGSLQQLTRAADQNQVPISSLHMRSCTLEDVFLKLTGRSLRDG